MTDKELLELAAKAAGATWIDSNFDYDDFGRLMLDFGNGCQEWNPLTDDGDALRLAIKLGIVPQSKCSDEYDRLYAASYVYNDLGIEIASVREPYIDDPYAATRRAIVRAAAEIGKGVK